MNFDKLIERRKHLKRMLESAQRLGDHVAGKQGLIDRLEIEILGIKIQINSAY